jgi:hypothetical protein
MTPFVQSDSIVRRIWGDADVVLLIFGGGAGEFALNRAVDWLFFTGVLPADPVGRFFSTVAYAQKTVFADKAQADRTLEKIYSIHRGVEENRGERIPAWAYRDVLYILIHYSESAYRTLHRPLTLDEQEELYSVFRYVGEALHLPDLPENYAAWQIDRQRLLREDLVYSPYTTALLDAYRRDLGPWRYALLRQVQAILVPEIVRRLLNLPRYPWLRPVISLYPLLARLGLQPFIQRLLIPSQHLAAVQRLHTPATMTKATAASL